MSVHALRSHRARYAKRAASSLPCVAPASSTCYFFAGSAGAGGAGTAAGDGRAGGAGAAIVAGAEIGIVGALGVAAVKVFPSDQLPPSSGTIISATMLMILISGLTAGPAVSLYGSPTVSPVTAALCASDPLPP